MNKQIVLNLPAKIWTNSRLSFPSPIYFRYQIQWRKHSVHAYRRRHHQTMLTTESFLQSLIDKLRADAKQANEFVIALSCEGGKRWAA